MTTHIVLGTGAVGTALANHLVADGHAVRAVNRSGKRGDLADGIDLLAGDLTDPAFAREALAGGDVAYQVTQPAYHRWAQEFPALQRTVLEAAEEHGVAVVLADNLYAFGDAGGDVLTDASPINPISKKGEVRAAMAAEALALHEAGRVKVALTKPSNYVGGTYAMFRELVLDPIAAGKSPSALGKLDQPHSFSHVDDAARAMAAIGTSQKGWGRSWITPIMAPITQRDMLQRLWSAAGHDGAPKVRAMRGLPMRVLGLFIPALRESVEMMYEWEAPFVASSADFEKAFGFGARSWDDAVAEMAGAVKV